MTHLKPYFKWHLGSHLKCHSKPHPNTNEQDGLNGELLAAVDHLSDRIARGAAK